LHAAEGPVSSLDNEACSDRMRLPVRQGEERPYFCGNSSVVEHHLAKVGVAGSTPVSRSKARTSRDARLELSKGGCDEAA
jgi:hypothetical protein